MRNSSCFIFAFLLVAAAPSHAAGSITGRWINPLGSVIVTTGNCHDKLCGWVSWASEAALADATDAGVRNLVGTTLLQDYRARSPGRWAGRVFVPDMGRSFSSTIEQLDGDRLKISGCLIGGLLCKSQIWVRHEQ